MYTYTCEECKEEFDCDDPLEVGDQLCDECIEEDAGEFEDEAGDREEETDIDVDDDETEDEEEEEDDEEEA